MHDVLDSAGTNYILTASTTKLRKSQDGTGSFSDVKTGLTSGHKTKIAAIGNGEYVLCNSSDKPFVITGTGFSSALDLEITRPDIITAGTTCESSNSSGALTVASRYIYVLVYVTDNGDYSLPSQPISPINNASSNITGASDDTVTFANLPVSTDARVTKRHLYRTKALSNSEFPFIFYLVAKLDNTATSFIDNAADTDLDLSQIAVYANVFKGKYPAVNRDRLFIGYPTVDVRNYLAPAYSSGQLLLGSPCKFKINSSSSGGNLDADRYYKYRLVFVDENGILS